MNEKKLYTARQLANLMGVHPNTIYNWRDRGWITVDGKSPSGREFYSEDQVKKLQERLYGII